MPETSRRIFRAAALLAFPRESCGKPPLLSATQSNLNVAKVLHDSIEKRFEDLVLDRDKLVSALKNFEKQARNAKSNLSCVEKKKKSICAEDKTSKSKCL